METGKTNPPFIKKKKGQKKEVCISSEMPAECLAAAAFPQHLLKHENMPVKSRSFYNKPRAAASPVSSLDAVPRFPPREEEGGAARLPRAHWLHPGWWVSCPSRACSGGRLWLGTSKGSKPGGRVG